MKSVSAIVAAFFCGVAVFYGGVNAQTNLKSASSTPVTNQPKFFAVDVDGTFASKKTKTLKKNIVAFNKATAAGNTLFFATGRSPASVRSFITNKYFGKTGYNGNPGVFLDGALVYDEKGGIVQERPLPPELLEEIANVTKNRCNTYMPVFCTAEEVLMVCEINFLAQAVFKAYLSASEIRLVTIEELKTQKVYNVVVRDVEGILATLREQNKDDIQSGGEEVAARYDPSNYYLLPLPFSFTQIADKQVSKADGIKALLAHYGADFSNCGCIGDGLNDLEMMRAASLSIAVGNAVPQAKEAVKMVLKETCDEGAFAKAMEKVYGIQL